MALRLRNIANNLVVRSSPASTALPVARPPAFPAFQPPFRTMATSETVRKYEWLVVVPDFPGALEKRREMRPHHFAGLKPAKESGLFQMGGAILNSVPKDDEPSSLDMAGSTIVMVAESKAEVIEVLKKDIYATSGVWDVDNAQMWPLKCAFRISLNP